MSDGADSTESLMADNNDLLQHWATSNGPDRPAASMAKDSPSTTVTPAATGSTPSRTKARSRKDTAGWTTRSTDPSTTAGCSMSRDTVRSATVGDPGTAYTTLAPRPGPASPPAPATAAAMTSMTMARYTSSNPSARS